MKNNKSLYIVLCSILLVLIASSVYVNFIAKDAKLVSYILLAQIIIGVGSAIITLFLCKNKKTSLIFLIAFLQVLFALGMVILNTVYGYKNMINLNDYSIYMEYVSMNLNIYIFLGFGLIMGLFTVDQYIKTLK